MIPITQDRKTNINRRPFFIVAATTFAAVLISVICLISGWLIIFQNLFYIPIIIACIYYRKRGFIFSIAVSFFYLFLVIIFTHNSAVIIQALIRTLLFIGIAGVTAFLSIKLSLAEKGLGESDKKFQKMLERMPLPVVYLSKDGGIIFRNERFIKLFGYTAKDVPTISEWWMNAFPDPQYRQWAMQEWNSAIENAGAKDTDIEPRDIRVACKDGSVCEVIISGILINDSLLVTFIDITERKIIANELEESQQKFKGMVETLYDWIWEVDVRGRYTYVSPQIKNILGFEPEEVLGKTPLDLMSSKEKNRIAESFNQIINTQKPIVALENVNLHKDGHPVVIETNGLPFYDADGKIKGYRGTDRDITERKKVEYKLKERIKELRAFYNLAELSSKEETTIEKIFQDFVNIMPQSWQYPEVCCARIVMENNELRSDNFKESAWMQSAPIKAFKSVTGKIEVGYLDERPNEDEGPFLKEERLLIDTLAERLGHIVERKRHEDQIQKNEARLTSLINIIQYKAETAQEFLDNALNEAIKLTESKIGYIYFYNEDRKEFVLNTWSKDVMKECTIVEPQTCYELDKTGIWGEAVRQRRPIILNDFQASHPLKKGYPSGHAHLLKYMTLPVIRRDQIVAVVGVANKLSDYNNTDVLQLSLLMDTVWNYVDIKKAEEALRKSSDMVKLLLDSSAEAVYGLDMNGLCTFNNAACLKMLGYRKHEELLGKNMHDMIHSKHADGTAYDVHQCPIFKAFKKGEKAHVDNEVLWRKDGTCFDAEYWSYPVIRDKEVIGAVVTFLDISDRKKAEFELQKSTEAREELIKELQSALENVKTLQGLIPICANCKKIRDDQGYWNQVEGYLMEHTDAEFSHGLCPECGRKLYGDLYDNAVKKDEERKKQ